MKFLMFKKGQVISGSILLAFLCISISSETPIDSRMSGYTQLLSRQLYEEMRHKDGNFLFSPFNVGASLAVTYIGAAGNTSTQIRSKTNFSVNAREIGRMFGLILYKILQPSKLSVLKTANILLVPKEADIEWTFLKQVHYGMRVGFNRVNFSQSKDLVIKINNQLSNMSDSKCKTFLKADEFNHNTTVVLLNMIYFKGELRHKVKNNEQTSGEFFVNNNKTITTNYVTVVTKYPVISFPDVPAFIVESPFEDEHFSMVLIIPNANDGLAEVEESLKSSHFKWSLPISTSLEVKLQVPEITTDETLELRETLIKMGITDLFSNKSNLHAMSQTPIEVSNFVQKACIEINIDELDGEKEKAPPVALKKADRPFIYYIVHRPSRVVLFVGRFLTPTQESHKSVKTKPILGRFSALTIY